MEEASKIWKFRIFRRMPGESERKIQILDFSTEQKTISQGEYTFGVLFLKRFLV